MKIYITGATGFIGSHLAHKLLDHGYDVTCVIRTTSNTRWLTGRTFSFSYTDFSKESLSRIVHDADYIVHVAGVIKALSYKDYLEGNWLATKNLVEASLESKNLKRFIHISSLAVCGSAPQNNPHTEQGQLKPVSWYGKTKMLAENEVRKYSDKLPVTVIRPPVVYGPKDEGLLPYFRLIKKGLVAIAGGRRYISMIHVADLADAVILFLKEKRSISQTYFVTNKEIYNIEHVTKLAAKFLGRSKLIRVNIPSSFLLLFAEIYSAFTKPFGINSMFNANKARELVQKHWICSGEKIRRELNFEPKVKLENGMKETIQWYLSEGWL